MIIYSNTCAVHMVDTEQHEKYNKSMVLQICQNCMVVPIQNVRLSNTNDGH